MKTTEKASHTPGPWTLGTGYLSPFVIAPSPSGGAHPITIAQCPHPADAFFSHQRQANARLIAAAPEMLEALEAAYEKIECFDVQKHNSGTCLCRRMQAAIRKAKGE